MKVFISYTSADEKIAQFLTRDLKNAGIEVWFAPDNLKPADSLFSIHDQMEKVDFVIFLISTNSIKSRWVKHEINFALSLYLMQKPLKILPLYLDNIPRLPELAEFKDSNLRENYLDQDIEKIIHVLNGDAIGTESITDHFLQFLDKLIPVDDDTAFGIDIAINSETLEEKRVKELLEEEISKCPSLLEKAAEFRIFIAKYGIPMTISTKTRNKIMEVVRTLIDPIYDFGAHLQNFGSTITETGMENYVRNHLKIKESYKIRDQVMELLKNAGKIGLINLDPINDRTNLRKYSKGANFFEFSTIFYSFRRYQNINQIEKFLQKNKEIYTMVGGTGWLFDVKEQITAHNIDLSYIPDKILIKIILSNKPD